MSGNVQKSNGYICNLHIYGSQNMDLATALCESWASHLLESITMFSVTISSLQLARDLLKDETYVWNNSQQSPRSPNGLSTQKADMKAFRKGKSKSYRHGNTVASVQKRHKVSLLSSHTIQSSWQRNCEQKPAWWIYHSSFHCPCRHFVQQEHGRSRPEWSAKTVLRCGPQVAQVVALPAVVLVDISIVNAHILETEADNIPPHLNCSSKLS